MPTAATNNHLALIGARRRIEQDAFFLKDHTRVLADLLRRTEQDTGQADSLRDEVIEQLWHMVIWRTVDIFQNLSDVQAIVGVVLAADALPGAEKTRPPEARATRTFQTAGTTSPAARLRTARRQIEWDLSLLMGNLKTLADTVRQAEACGVVRLSLQRDIGQLTEAIAQRSAEIWRGIIDIKQTVTRGRQA